MWKWLLKVSLDRFQLEIMNGFNNRLQPGTALAKRKNAERYESVTTATETM